MLDSNFQAMPENSDNCFSYLYHNISKWRAEIDDITKKIEAKQEEIARVPVSLSETLVRNASTESIKPVEGDNAAAESTPSPKLEVTSAPEPDTAPTPLAARIQNPLFARRKRKSASVLSGNQSGPAKYRSRSLIVVYYDSEIQKSFETLVRNMGVGRNMLRKGKMSARINALSDLVAEDDEEDDDDNEDVDASLAKIGYQPKAGLKGFPSTRFRGPPGPGLPSLRTNASSTESYDLADAALDRAQTFCEKGAHQFLRDGDCTDELTQCKAQFDEIFTVAEREFKKLDSHDKMTVRQQLKAYQASSERPSSSTPLTSVEPPKMMELEVDDDEGDDELVMPAMTSIRLTSRV